MPPHFTTAITVFIGISYLISILSPGSIDVFTLVPLNTIITHFYVWNLITCGFFETKLFLAVVTIVGLLFIGERLELLWGPKEFITFIAIINSAVSIATFFTAYICYMLHMEWMMSQYYTGFIGIFGALTIGWKQAFPDGEISISVVAIRAKYAPFFLAIFGVTLDIIVRNGPEAKAIATVEGTAPAGSHCPTLLYGMLFGWIYLRFFQAKGMAMKDGSAVYGDLSDSGAFHMLFPDAFQPVFALIGGVMYNALRALRCCDRWHQQYQEQLQSLPCVDQDALIFSDSNRGSQTVSTSTAAAERRRKLALEALEARLKDVKRPLPNAANGKADAALTAPLDWADSSDVV